MRRLRALAGFSVLGIAVAAWGAGGGGGGSMGGMGGGGGGSPRGSAAEAAFEKGEALRKQAVEALDIAEHGKTEELRAQGKRDAAEKLEGALKAYGDATRKDRKHYAAWNGLGYTQRMLGSYAEALESYDRALEIKPGFPNAVEYRGEAFLMLGRLEDAKAAYMDLFGRQRSLAEMLLKKMQEWVVAARGRDPAPVDAASLDAFSKWVEERAEIAGQTASLAPEADAAGSW